ncbi:uncharacterized methyltransferase YdaC-like [Antedon mediterranea]|uniref:uncharacterized methyltransferase YdaC-like n=1 Tax=Antedon mediterranea TaxID=105859 RepID=UPI003AF5E9C6
MGLTDVIADNLRKPGSGLTGWIISKLLKKKNSDVITHAVGACSVEPDHHVLEVGFGPGIGMAAVADIIKTGSGKVYGVDFSQSMVEEATNRLSEEIKRGKAEVQFGDVASLPFQDGSMHRILHTNCYYFWPDMNAATKELYRVLKPGGLMITTFVYERLVTAEARGFLPPGVWKPERYIDGLNQAGFQNVERKSELGRDEKTHFDVIYAYKNNDQI